MAPFDKSVARRMRADGFKGSGKHFRRVVGPFHHFITHQYSRNSREFCINAGVHLSFLPSTPGYEHHPRDLTKLTALHCPIRVRVTEEPWMCDQWWNRDEPDWESVRQAYEVTNSIFFGFWTPSRTTLLALTIDDLDYGHYKKLIPPFPEMSVEFLAMLISRFHLFLGNKKKAKAYAEYGLKLVGDLNHPFTPTLQYALDYGMESEQSEAAEEMGSQATSIFLNVNCISSCERSSGKGFEFDALFRTFASWIDEDTAAVPSTKAVQHVHVQFQYDCGDMLDAVSGSCITGYSSRYRDMQAYIEITQHEFDRASKKARLKLLYERLIKILTEIQPQFSKRDPTCIGPLLEAVKTSLANRL